MTLSLGRYSWTRGRLFNPSVNSHKSRHTDRQTDRLGVDGSKDLNVEQTTLSTYNPSLPFIAASSILMGPLFTISKADV